LRTGHSQQQQARRNRATGPHSTQHVTTGTRDGVAATLAGTPLGGVLLQWIAEGAPLWLAQALLTARAADVNGMIRRPLASDRHLAMG
jgi:hypothetical protein